jgi:hypothetical protein
MSRSIAFCCNAPSCSCNPPRRYLPHCLPLRRQGVDKPPASKPQNATKALQMLRLCMLFFKNGYFIFGGLLRRTSRIAQSHSISKGFKSLYTLGALNTDI